MNEEEIAEKIRYILEPVGESHPLFYRKRDTSGDLGREYEFANEYVELLLQLASRIDTQTGRDFFCQLLGYNFVWPITLNSKNILPSIPKRKAFLLCRQHCDISAMVYIKSARTDKVLDGLLERIKDYGSINEANNKTISCLLEVAMNEPCLFSDEQLKKIEVIIIKLREYINKVDSLWKEQQENKLNLSKFLPGIPLGQIQPPLPSREQVGISGNLVVELKRNLTTIRFKRVKEELKGVSSVINQDKKQLISKYGELGLDKELIEAVERIDNEIEETGSKFEFSKIVGFVRNIYEESLREFAIKIRDIKGLDIPQWTDNKGKMGEAISYFRKINLISEKEEKFLTGFSGLISDTGSHSLTSEKFEVRIAKNILVEICFYLADKIGEFLKSGARGS